MSGLFGTCVRCGRSTQVDCGRADCAPLVMMESLSRSDTLREQTEERWKVERDEWRKTAQIHSRARKRIEAERKAERARIERLESAVRARTLFAHLRNMGDYIRIPREAWEQWVDEREAALAILRRAEGGSDDA